MKKVLFYLMLTFLLMFFVACVVAQGTQSLSGTLVDPAGNGVNGYLHISLPNGTIKNTCVTPWAIVPKASVTYAVANGVIVNGSSSSYVPTDCLYPRVPYNVEVDDVNNNFMLNDNWYIPSSTDTSVDVGTLVEENFGGPIAVAIPKGIISNPSVSQTITQPNGTSITLNGTVIINGVTFATASGGISFPGVITTTSATNQTITQTGGSTLFINGNFVVNGKTPFDSSGNPLLGVTAWNTRTGAVVPASGDYTCAQVTGCATAFYSTIKSAGVAVAQEHTANFGSEFLVVDNPGQTRTDIDLATTGVSSGTYTNPSSVTVNTFGQITSITGSASPTTAVTYSWSFAGCHNGTSQPVRCVSSFSLPINMPDSNYQITCMTNSDTQASSSINLQTLGAALPTSAGSSISYSLVQTMQNGTGGSTPTVMCTLHHN